MPDSVNKFKQAAVDLPIINKKTGKKVGKLRIKSSTVLWAPKSAHKYYSISLKAFDKWITENGKEVSK